MKCHYSNPILYEGHVYGLDNGILACVRLTDGKRTWKGGRYGHGQMLLRGSVFVILSEKGEIAMVEANPEEYHELGKIQALDDFKTWNNPALVGNRLYVRNHVKMAAYALPLEKRGP
jgi:outer membrane protein assembly factor BamB